jgi:excisionase family DNA binding protein
MSVLAPAPTGAAPPETAALERVLAELRVIRELIEQTRKPILTVAEVARLVGRSEYTVRRWVGEGRLPATRVSGTGPAGRLLVRRDDVDRLIATGSATERPTDAPPTP